MIYKFQNRNIKFVRITEEEYDHELNVNKNELYGCDLCSLAYLDRSGRDTCSACIDAPEHQDALHVFGKAKFDECGGPAYFKEVDIKKHKRRKLKL